jgi:ribosome recycling factor
MQEEVITMLREAGDQAIDALQKGLMRIRTGRANLTVLDNVRVDYYGSKVPLNQVASLSVPDPRLITIKPFDKSAISDIEKAIRANSELGLSPQNDGDKVLLPIPALTEERRKEFTKVAKTRGEEAKISVRNARRDANEAVKQLEKDGDLPEDDCKKTQDRVQKMTDDFVTEIERMVAKKEKEIMEV